MSNDRLLDCLFVLGLLFVCQGKWLAFAEEKELTPEELAYGIAKWQKALEYYWAAADNGLKEGASCEWDLNALALILMTKFIGKTAEELERQFKEGGAEEIAEEGDDSAQTELGKVLRFLTPELHGSICAAAYNLNCGGSAKEDSLNETSLKCEPCTCEADRPKLCEVVDMIEKDRNLNLLTTSEPKCQSGDRGDKNTTNTPSTTKFVTESTEPTSTSRTKTESDPSVGQKSGVSYSAGGNSCRFLLIIGSFTTSTVI